MANAIQGSGTPFGPQNLFAGIHAQPGIQEQFDRFADDILSQVRWLRGEFDNSKAMRRAVEQYPTDQPARGTGLISRDLISRFLKDKLLKLNRNNAIDLTHAVVAVSYCDFVLLDAQWASMVNACRQRITKAGLSLPMAKVFSKKGNGIAELLKELEALIL
jgi:hypothetical protein